MDAPHDRMKHRNPGPWRFYVRRYGLVHIIADANGEPIATSVPIGSGPAPRRRTGTPVSVAARGELAPIGSPAHNVAVAALEQFAEREGMVLADWQPDTVPRPRPTLRIVGFAT